MAEFKLGRIRFVWKNIWASGTTYYVDDVIKHGGQVYICQVGHTANSNFYNDLNAGVPRWNLMSSGTDWKNSWTTATLYKVNDIVSYGGQLYICNLSHTSAATSALGLENDLSKWDNYAKGFDWKGQWTTSFRYKLNDIVQYGGYTYVCNTGHTSAATTSAGLEFNQSSWDTFNAGTEYKTNWSGSTRYKINDVVKYGAGLWICTASHTSTASFLADSSNWSQYSEAIEYESTWNISTIYQPGDIVSYGGNQYIARSVHSGSVPSTSPNWDLFSQGFNNRGDWNLTTSYLIGDVVSLGGHTYIATTDIPLITATVTGTTSSSPFTFTCSSTTGMVAGMVVRFSGSVFGNVALGATYYIRSVTGPFTFTVSTQPSGTTFVPSTATGSMTARVSPDPTNISYWLRLNHGVNWRNLWIDDTEYFIGDSVRYGSNTYICVRNHRSESDDGSTIRSQGGGEANSRPDNDTTGTYWNALTLGSETSVLTTKGDMVYYGGAGPTRLPIGTSGQVLTVGTNDTPEWQYLWGSDHVYYVAPHGVDTPYPEQGGTLQNPWKSIRYACEQVEKGPRNPNAQYLLELNRAFIQKEITDWIRAQVAGNIAPFTSSFDYDEYKCERDVGFIVDRLIWDLGHGGNLKMRSAALSLIGAFGETGEFSASTENRSYITLAAEADEGIAAYNYMKTLVSSVLNNQAPSVVYQNVGQDSTAIVTQYIDTTYTAEPGTITTTGELIDIVITALTDQNSNNIPERIVPNNVINVKTGEYRETLPIIVPAETCILGDEVRSVNAGPADSLVNLSDSSYSIGALGRLETVASQVILGTDVTESTGNTEIQSRLFPYASSVESTQLTRLVRMMQHRIDWRLQSNALTILTDPTGYNVGYLTGYGDARTLLQENKEFIKDEIISFIAVNYPTVKYSKTACRRDVGFIVDAMCYDLTYGGWSQSLNAGLAYFDGPGSALMIDSTELTATIASYNRLKTVMQQIAANTSVTRSTGNTTTQWTDSSRSSGSAASSFIGSNVDIITAILTAQNTNGRPNITVTSITGANTLNTTAAHGLAAGDLFVPRTTANGLTADTRYYVLSSGLTGTAFQISTSYGGTAVSGLTNGTGLSIVSDYIRRPAATNSVSTTTALITAWTTLSAAVNTIVTNMTTFLSTNYPTLSYNTAKCQRDVRMILDAVGYDFMFNSNFQSMRSAYAYLRASASDVFTLGQKTATRAAFEYVRTQARANVGGNATAQSRIDTLMTLIDDIVFGATDEGSVCQTDQRSADWARLQLERNRQYIAAEISAWIGATYRTTVTAATATTDIFTCSSTSWMRRNTAIRFSGTTFGGITAGVTYYVQNVVSATEFKIATTRNSATALDISSNASGSMTVALYYNTDLCNRDVNSYIDALKFDIQYPGNYKSRFAARYYINAVVGSLEEDMYYLRNGTGIRNQTLEGLTGDLLAPNAYGTSRVSAGAYVSLDPGWGPDDFRTWIISRSPYVQNVTTFGTAAVGQKIDGALHNGGNDSIVSNDFTQLISDGIGAWVTNNGRAELVSVFTYYSHIGYLSEAGGRIRGTNGNNSYGDFGSVAEGFDATETPGVGAVDNRNFRAFVGSVFTDGANRILQFEYDNAGSEYTEATWTINGSGSGASLEQDEFRDGAVFEVRLLDNVDDSTNAPEADGNFGGFGYITNSNTAQGGTTTQITIAATDSEVSTAYVGMKIWLTGGGGAGQYGIISTYNAGTKVATVIRESTGASGWDHIVPGTTIVAPDASTTYTIEPSISFSSPSYSSTSRTLATSMTYVDVRFARRAETFQNLSPTGGSGTGARFDVTRKGTKYATVTLVNAGTGYTRLNTLTIPGTSLGTNSTSPANDLTITITAVNSVNGAIQAYEFTGIGHGGNFVAISSGTRTVNTSPDGTTWQERLNALPSISNWAGLAGGDLTVSENAGSFVTGRTYIIDSPGNTTWTSVGAANNLAGTQFVAINAGSGSGTARPIATSMVAISSSTTVNAYSLDGGITWTAGGALPAGISGTSAAVAYGNGRWIVIGSGGATAVSSNGGVSWTAGGALPAGTWTSIVYGEGFWVAVGANVCATSTNNGTSWTSRTIGTGTWNSVAYGKNTFVAISGAGGTTATYSQDGITWISSTIPSATYTRVRYGQGIFFAVGTSTQAASSEDGINWTSRTMSTAANGFSSIAFGNPNNSGVWAAVQRSTASTVASSVLIGCTARARAFVANEKIFAIRMIEPGSGYTVAPTVTITDPNNLYEAPTQVRIGAGALANPSFVNRGTGYISASAAIDTGNGYADVFQSGQFIAVKRLTKFPVPGSNVVLGHLPNTTFKLVNVLTQLGTVPGDYRAFFQIAPTLELINAPAHEQSLTTRIRYSQVRLTGHDFLDIGTGSFDETNYPGGTPDNAPSQANEVVENNGGRVFYSSTDQDGNFRVGDLFTIEQSTGVATLNADAFNIAGLQELTLGNLALGGGSATISEFSTDPFFTANSDSVVPTQRAVKAYIASQIGGGGAALNVNSVTAGSIFISNNQITTTTGSTVNINARLNFTAGVTGIPLAFNYFIL
jgi:hypothetical protein